MTKIEKKFILHNQKKWRSKNSATYSNNIILVDLFNWNPWIYIWSYLTNILSLKTKGFDIDEIEILFKILLVSEFKIYK